ncbi:MAG: ferrous iron transport protein B [Candidatus Micrarchaeota archaeon]
MTGGQAEVGNWPGKTVEKKTGILLCCNERITVVDLPGTYSLSAFSAEELIARDFIIERQPETVINIIDASNLERNLYLTVQLLELGTNIIIALNMQDIAQEHGIVVDAGGLAELLGVPTIPIIANTGLGVNKLISAAAKMAVSAQGKKHERLKINYGKYIEPKITRLAKHLRNHSPLISDRYGARWLAMKLIEKDPAIIKLVRDADHEAYDKIVIKFIENTEQISEEDIGVEIADKRYEFIHDVVSKTLTRSSVAKINDRISSSDQIDSILTNQWLGIPLFLFFTYLLYQMVFIVGEPFVWFIQGTLDLLAVAVREALVSNGAPEIVVSLVSEGILQGVGNVFVFLPNIALLFFAIALLEDSGYMARVAFVMDRFMRMIGLQGKSFIPLVIAFGCTVPAIMATRTMENERDRVVTIMISSIIPCSARMAVFVFIAGAMFQPNVAGQVVWSLVLLSFALVIFMSLLFKYLFGSKHESMFIMELPQYQLPNLNSLKAHTLQRTKMFIKKAGTFIFLATIVLWFLASNPYGITYGSEQSYLGQIGKTISPLFAPLEIGWHGSVALISGFFAKETIISVFGVLYGSENMPLNEVLAGSWTRLQAYVFMVFTLLYIPCFATVAVIKRETRSWKWTLFALCYTFILAWGISYLVLQFGHFLGY